jgi:hypothetical protein
MKVLMAYKVHVTATVGAFVAAWMDGISKGGSECR